MSLLRLARCLHLVAALAYTYDFPPSPEETP